MPDKTEKRNETCNCDLWYRFGVTTYRRRLENREYKTYIPYQPDYVYSHLHCKRYIFGRIENFYTMSLYIMEYNRFRDVVSLEIQYVYV